MPSDINLIMGTEKPQTKTEIKRILPDMIPPHSIRTRHLEAGLFAIKIGFEADRPDTGNQFPLYFSSDTHKFSYWTGSVWIQSAALT